MNAEVKNGCKNKNANFKITGKIFTTNIKSMVKLLRKQFWPNTLKKI